MLKTMGDSGSKGEVDDSENGDNCDAVRGNIEDNDDDDVLKQDCSSDTSEKDRKVESDKEKGLLENKIDKSECKVGIAVEEKVVNRTSSDESETSKQSEFSKIDDVTDSNVVSHEPDSKCTDSVR